MLLDRDGAVKEVEVVLEDQRKELTEDGLSLEVEDCRDVLPVTFEAGE